MPRVDSSRLPTFIIGGAPRSGTTSLCYALDCHPDVGMAKPFIPEPKVLLQPVSDPSAYMRIYADLFARHRGARARGEKTSYYLESAECCGRIRDMLPEVRTLFVVREPVSRAYSNYLWSRKNGLETLSFEEAIALEGQRPSPLSPDKAYARPFDYLSRGDYATFARRYYEALGWDRVAFFLYEGLAGWPEAVFRAIQMFIGVDPIPFAQCDPGVVNSAREIGPPIDPAVEAALRERMAPQVQAFADLTGLDLTSWGYDTAGSGSAVVEGVCADA